LLRRYATSRTVPGSIHGSVTGFYSDISSDRTIALGSIQTCKVEITTDTTVGRESGEIPKCAHGGSLTRDGANLTPPQEGLRNIGPWEKNRYDREIYNTYQVDRH
jgi:hypothetical protein